MTSIRENFEEIIRHPIKNHQNEHCDQVDNIIKKVRVDIPDFQKMKLIDFPTGLEQFKTITILGGKTRQLIIRFPLKMKLKGHLNLVTWY